MTTLAFPRFSIGAILDRFEFTVPWFALAPLLLIPVLGNTSSGLNTLLSSSTRRCRPTRSGGTPSYC